MKLARIFLVILGGWQSSATAADHEWKTAKVVDSSTAKTYVDGAVGPT